MGTGTVRAVSEPVREWLVAADDRTGAFEVAALFAQVVGPVTVTVGAAPTGSGVVDLASRAMSADDAAHLASAIDASPSAWVAHKIDSTLRGNWAAELMARQRATGRRVVVLPGWPELGRTCVGGVVFVDGAPIGNVCDQLGDPDLLADADDLRGWLAGNATIAVCDVPNADAVITAAKILADHNVLVAGPAGPIGAAFAARRATGSAVSMVEMAQPVLVVCGSVNPVSLEQVRRLQSALPDVAVIATSVPEGELHAQAVVALAAQARLLIAELQPRTLVIIGGDTAAELLGSAPRLVSGFAAIGMPVSVDAAGGGPLVITKAGGFGGPDALVDLLRGENG